uniref:Uncharacterized protein n=1 Tax=Timema bartmani TaxID=61472 RepID=A0A7R9EQS1_9NEOP|nr:unnamed protein product [Timema bartmani]
MVARHSVPPNASVTNQQAAASLVVEPMSSRVPPRVPAQTNAGAGSRTTLDIISEETAQILLEAALSFSCFCLVHSPSNRKCPIYCTWDKSRTYQLIVDQEKPFSECIASEKFVTWSVGENSSRNGQQFARFVNWAIYLNDDCQEVSCELSVSTKEAMWLLETAFVLTWHDLEHVQYSRPGSNIDLPVIGSPVYFESDTLDHTAIEVASSFKATATGDQGARPASLSRLLREYHGSNEVYPYFLERDWKTILEKPPSVHPIEIRTCLPVIGSLVYCASSALDHAVTENFVLPCVVVYVRGTGLDCRRSAIVICSSAPRVSSPFSSVSRPDRGAALGRIDKNGALTRFGTSLAGGGQTLTIKLFSFGWRRGTLLKSDITVYIKKKNPFAENTDNAHEHPVLVMSVVKVSLVGSVGWCISVVLSELMCKGTFCLNEESNGKLPHSSFPQYTSSELPRLYSRGTVEDPSNLRVEYCTIQPSAQFANISLNIHAMANLISALLCAVNVPRTPPLSHSSVPPPLPSSAPLPSCRRYIRKFRWATGTKHQAPSELGLPVTWEVGIRLQAECTEADYIKIPLKRATYDLTYRHDSQADKYT